MNCPMNDINFKNKKCLILHSPLTENSPADELDVLDQVGFFNQALQKMGVITNTLAFPYDLMKLEEMISDYKPDFIVNLVETLFGDGRMVHLGPVLFDHFKMPYTGCPAHSIYISSHKILSKEIMKSHGINTPDYFTYHGLKNADVALISQPFLVKSLWEHASFGLDEAGKLLFDYKKELLERFEKESKPQDFFCEQYIHGREFNLSLLGGKNGAEVLPPAEIQFFYPDNKPRILGYKAKWEEESFEYKHTVRTFDFPNHDQVLIKKLSDTAIRCWNVFDLKGYARVDFRVDNDGEIYVLEINANPCISPDSGFVAAAYHAGLTQAEIIERILEDMQYN
jgi:D-alanine-D-alanine ligase